MKAALLRAGMTSRDIAQRMTTSEPTAYVIVANLLAALEYNARRVSAAEIQRRAGTRPSTQDVRFDEQAAGSRPTTKAEPAIVLDPPRAQRLAALRAARVPAGTPVSVLTDTGRHVKRSEAGSSAELRGWSRLAGRAGHGPAWSRLQTARHADGWVREIACKDEDARVKADFHPESGVVTVFEGDAVFRAVARAAHRAELPKRRVEEYMPHRLSEVEAAANAVHHWRPSNWLERRFAGQPPLDPTEYAGRSASRRRRCADSRADGSRARALIPRSPTARGPTSTSQRGRATVSAGCLARRRGAPRIARWIRRSLARLRRPPPE
jgi:hypothetical protein